MPTSKDIVEIKPKNSICGELSLPPDKSISHRALLFPSIYLEATKITIPNLLYSSDIKATIQALIKLGVKINIKVTSSHLCRCSFVSLGKGNFSEPEDIIDAMNSGTTARLLLGILSTCNFFSVITGDNSLRRRPMGRVTKHLIKMGAIIKGRGETNLLPLAIVGKSTLKGGDFNLEVASAQVKSAILLAARGVKGRIKIKEPYKSRDHSERFLKFIGVNLKEKDNEIIIDGTKTFSQKELNISIPGDISSAAFFLAAAAALPNSSLIIKDVGLNPTRTGVLDILRKMGAKIEVKNKPYLYEPLGDIKIEYSHKLSGVEIRGDIIPRIIDELPIIGVLATQAEGSTIIRDAQELRFKETDRIKGLVENLSLLGADIRELKDGLIIKGKTKLKGDVTLDSYKDHRLFMAFAIAGLLSKRPIYIKGKKSTDISFPNFLPLLFSISK